MLAARLKEIRESRGWSQNRLAREAEVAQQTIQSIEAGSGNPTWDTACKLADALACSLDDFRGGKNSRKKSKIPTKSP